MSSTMLMRPYGHSLAIVVFGPSSLRCLKVLKSGYQHCFVATQDSGQWHLMDPLSNGTQISLLGPTGVDEIIAAFRHDGYDALAVQRRAPVQSIMPLSPFTCVEAVKRVLGVRQRWIMTPWQLRKYLGKMIGETRPG